jgi:hypothetical protein
MKFSLQSRAHLAPSSRRLMFSQAEQVDREREEEEVIKKAAGDAVIHFLINLLSQLILGAACAPSPERVSRARRGLNQFRF